MEKMKPMPPMAPMKPLAPLDDRAGGATPWWPASLGAPSSSGAAGDTRYAVFESTRRLAVDDGKKVRIFDTGTHRIDGISQSSGKGLHFTSDEGTVGLDALHEVADRTPGTGAR